MFQPEVTVGIFGPKNSGKSTLFSILSGKKIKLTPTIKFEIGELYIPNFKINLLDTTGSRKYIKNMIRAISFCDFGILNMTLDSKNIEINLEEFLILSKGFDIKKLIICVNKIDLHNYLKDKFQIFSKEITNLLKKFEITNFVILPISNKFEENIFHEKKDKLKWFEGKSLIEELNSMKSPVRDFYSPLRISILDKYPNCEKNKLILAKIESGIFDNRNDIKTASGDLKSANRRYIPSCAIAGELVVMSIRQVEIGDVLGNEKNHPPALVRKFEAKIKIFCKSLKKGSCPIVDVHSDHVTSKLNKIESRIDQKTDIIQEGESEIVEFEPKNPMCIEVGNKFLIRDGNSIIGIGEVTKIYLKDSIIDNIEDEFISEISIENAKLILDKNHFIFENFPLKLRSNIDVATHAVQKNDFAFLHISEDLKNDQEFLIANMTNFGYPILFISDKLRSDEKFAHEIITKDKKFLKYFGSNVRDSKYFIKNFIDEKTCDYISYELRNDSKFMKELMLEYEFIDLLMCSIHLKNDEDFLKFSLIHDGLNLEDVPEKLISKEFVKLAFESNGESIKYCPKSYLDDESLVMNAIKSYGTGIKYLPESLKKKKSIVLEAVKNDSIAFSHVKKYFVGNEEILLASLSQSYTSLYSADHRLLNDKNFMQKVLKIQPYAIQLASNDLQNDRSLLLECVKNNGSTFRLMQKFWDDEEILFEALKNINSKERLDYLIYIISPNKWLRNFNFLKNVIRFNHLLFNYLPDYVCNDNDLVIDILKDNYKIFPILCDTCRNDFEIVRIAIQRDPKMISDISNDLKQNQEVIWISKLYFKLIRDVKNFNLSFKFK